MHEITFHDGRRLPVGKIVCVGRNYADHVAEMAAERPRRPVLFLKPSTALLAPGAPIRLPALSHEIHHEVELVAVVGRRARNVAASEALTRIHGYAVGLDLTARDLQREAKRRGEPWAVAKGFDGSAPVSRARAADEVGDPGALALVLRVNGAVRQSATTASMLFPVAELVAYASSIFTLEPGDLLFTGTPAGVGPIAPGDLLEAELTGVAHGRWRVAPIES